MLFFRIVLVLLALALPALAQNGANNAAAGREAAQAFRVYIDGVTKDGGRPDLTQPDVAALLGRIFDLDALNALPPPHGSDMSWLLDWMEAANATYKLLLGVKPGSQPDVAAIQRNMTEYEDQIAVAMNFMIRFLAREAVTSNKFMAALAPAERTRIREEGYTGSRHSAAEYVLAAVCSEVVGAGKPANSRLVAAAVRDTNAIWASFILPQDRARAIDVLNSFAKQVRDETARNDLATFTAALQAAN
jgi:hypothetical protein